MSLFCRHDWEIKSLWLVDYSTKSIIPPAKSVRAKVCTKCGKKRRP